MTERARRILVIGGSGFIGTHLCRRLQQDGYEPVVFDRVPPGVDGVEYHRGDMSTIADLFPSLFEDVVAVYHLAWSTKPQAANQDPLYDLQTNVVAGVHLLDGLAGLPKPPRVMFVSTGGAVYGRVTQLPVSEDHPTEPINAYGISKLTFEHYLRLYQRVHGLEYLVFRPGNPFGEGQDPAGAQGAVAVFMGRIARGQPVEIWGDGEVVRDYLYIDDLIDALVAGLDYRPDADGARVFNVGSGKGLSLNQLVREIERVSGRRADVRHSAARPVDVPKIVLSVKSIAEHMGWRPRTGLEEALRRTWQWITVEHGK